MNPRIIHAAHDRNQLTHEPRRDSPIRPLALRPPSARIARPRKNRTHTNTTPDFPATETPVAHQARPCPSGCSAASRCREPPVRRVRPTASAHDPPGRRLIRPKPEQVGIVSQRRKNGLAIIRHDRPQTASPPSRSTNAASIGPLASVIRYPSGRAHRQ